MYGLKPVPFTPFDFLRNGWNGGKGAENRRSGPSTPGVEGLPEADSPLDPGPGLGDILSLGLFPAKSSVI
jgi:hypothetical protein